MNCNAEAIRRAATALDQFEFFLSKGVRPGGTQFKEVGWDILIGQNDALQS